MSLIADYDSPCLTATGTVVTSQLEATNIRPPGVSWHHQHTTLLLRIVRVARHLRSNRLLQKKKKKEEIVINGHLGAVLQGNSIRMSFRFIYSSIVLRMRKGLGPD